MTEISPLRRRMIEDMTVRNLSPATQRSYVHAVARFGRFFGRSPERLGLEEVRAFQLHLAAGGISWPALTQTVCALRFLYGVTLKQADLPERIPYARTPRKVPVVLGADEVVRFLEAVPSLKARAALTTAYAAGLRRLWPEQTGHGPHAAAWFRHSPAGERHRHPHHPGPARAQQPDHHGALRAGRHQHHPRHGQSARPVAAGGDAAALRGGDAPGAGTVPISAASASPGRTTGRRARPR